MSKHRRPSSGHLATLPSRGARTSGAALLGTVLAVGVLPVTAGAAFAGNPSSSQDCGSLYKAVRTAKTTLAEKEALLKKVPADATDAVKQAAADAVKDAGDAVTTAEAAVKDCTTSQKDGDWRGGKDRGKGNGKDHGKDDDKDDHDGKWRDRDHDDHDDEDDDESTDDASTEKTDKTADKKTEVAAASDSAPTVVDVPATDTAGTSQVSSVPVGSVDAGDGSTADSHIGEALVGLGALGLAGAGAGAMVHRRRRSA